MPLGEPSLQRVQDRQGGLLFQFHVPSPGADWNITGTIMAGNPLRQALLKTDMADMYGRNV